ncbi:MAG: hypothetical protein ACLFUU_03805 [Desulfobacteraceae bacterium]
MDVKDNPADKNRRQYLASQRSKNQASRGMRIALARANLIYIGIKNEIDHPLRPG